MIEFIANFASAVYHMRYVLIGVAVLCFGAAVALRLGGDTDA